MFKRLSKYLASLMMGTFFITALSPVPVTLAAPFNNYRGEASKVNGILSGRVSYGPVCTFISFSNPIAPGGCTYYPYSNSLLSIYRQGNSQKVVMVRTDRNGYFQVTLKPGDYVVTEALSLPPFRSTPRNIPQDYHGFSQPASVTAGNRTYIEIAYNFLAQ